MTTLVVIVVLQPAAAILHLSILLCRPKPSALAAAVLVSLLRRMPQWSFPVPGQRPHRRRAALELTPWRRGSTWLQSLQSHVLAMATRGQLQSQVLLMWSIA